MKLIVPFIVFSIAILASGCAKSESEAKSPPVSVVFDGASTMAEVIPCATSFLKPLGTSPLLGRDFNPEDFQGETPAAAILGAEFWRAALASRPDVIGRTLQVGGQDFVIVGIAPDDPAALAGRKVWLATDI